MYQGLRPALLIATASLIFSAPVEASESAGAPAAASRLATQVELDAPASIAMGPSDILYVATMAGRLYQLDLRSGLLEPLVKDQSFQAGALQVTPEGKVIAANYPECKIVSIDPERASVETIAGRGRDDNGNCKTSGDGGSATMASFLPGSLTVDRQGNIFIADTENQRVRRIDARTGLIATVAGTGRAGSAGDGGEAASAQVYFPSNIGVDSARNIYISQVNSGRETHPIRKVDGRSGIITTLKASDFHLSKPLWDELPEPRLVFCDSLDNLYVLDKSRINYLDFRTRSVSTLAGSKQGFTGDGGPATRAELALPSSLAFDSQGNLFVADTANNRVRRIDRRTHVITTVIGNGKGPPPSSYVTR